MERSMRIAILTPGGDKPLAILFNEDHAMRIRDAMERFTHMTLCLVYDYEADLEAEYELGYGDGLAGR